MESVTIKNIFSEQNKSEFWFLLLKTNLREAVYQCTGDHFSIKSLTQKLLVLSHLGLAKKIIRVILFDDFALVNKYDSVGNLFRKAHFMDYANHDHSVLGKLFDGGWA